MEQINSVLNSTSNSKFCTPSSVFENPEQSMCIPNCQICGGLGWVHVDRPISHPEFGRLQPCPNQDFRKINGNRSGLTEKELKFSWNQIAKINGIDFAVKEIIEVLQQGHGWVFLWGRFGLGKSTLLKTICAESIRNSHESAYVRMVDIIDDLRNAYSTENPNEAAASRLARWTDIPILCIDEFDRVRMTEFAEERRFTLMDHRYEDAIRQKSITIMASNTDPRTFDGYLADRIFDGRFKVIQIQGNSARPNMTND